MRAITKYVAHDGEEFSTESKCAAHEALCAEVDALMARLPVLPKDDGCNFANGSGFIQHNPQTFLAVKNALLKLAQRFTDHHWIAESLSKGEEVHPSYAARIIGECCPRPVDRAWYRVYCTDKQSREWGQPYYRDNPEKAQQVCIADALSA